MNNQRYNNGTNQFYKTQKYDKAPLTKERLQVEELKLLKLRLLRCETEKDLSDGIINLLQNPDFEDYYKLISISYLLKDAMMKFAANRKAEKKDDKS